MPVITLLSDFGSMYPAQMKGVILRINPDVHLIDITHDIPPQDVQAGAFVLMMAAAYYPKGTVHVAVVDPGVGTLRRSILVESQGQIFVGPDNGLLIPAAIRLSQDITVREITNRKLFLTVSSTFHGRDIFAPVAAHLSKGLSPSDVGKRIDDYIKLDFGVIKIDGYRITGKVIYMDDFGNIITNIPGEQILKLFNYGDMLTAANTGMPFVRTFADVAHRELLMLIGSHGYLEISVNSGSAVRRLRLQIEDEIQISRMNTGSR